MPSQAVVWLEFLGICWYLLWTLYGLVRFLGSVIQEARSTPENLYLRNLEVRYACLVPCRVAKGNLYLRNLEVRHAGRRRR